MICYIKFNSSFYSLFFSSLSAEDNEKFVGMACLVHIKGGLQHLFGCPLIFVAEI